MTRKTRSAPPEELEPQALDAAVGGTVSAIVGPCNKTNTTTIADSDIRAAGGQCNKIVKPAR